MKQELSNKKALCHDQCFTQPCKLKDNPTRSQNVRDYFIGLTSKDTDIKSHEVKSGRNYTSAPFKNTNRCKINKHTLTTLHAIFINQSFLDELAL